MARMHSRAKGKSKSTKPIKKTVPAWIRYKDKEIELLIVKLAKEGKAPSKIGTILKDTYGIPCTRTAVGKKITKILEEKKLLSKIPEDLMALIKKSITIKAHMNENKKDQAAKHGMLLTESKIRRLVKYYKNSGKLDQDWTYDPDKIRLMIE